MKFTKKKEGNRKTGGMRSEEAARMAFIYN